MNTMDGVLNEFISEGEEILHRVSDLLQKIEKGGSTKESIGAIYRDVHTLKGNSQLFGFHKIALLSHVMEAVLDPIRKLDIEISPRLIECCLGSLDLLLRMLKGVLTNEQDQSFEKEVIRWVGLLVDAATKQYGASFRLNKDMPAWLENHRAIANNKNDSEQQIIEEVVAIQTPPQLAPQSVPQPDSTSVKPETKTHKEDEEKPVFHKKISPTTVEIQQTQSAQPAEAINTNQIDTSIRVPVPLLDKLMNLVGELVLIRNQFLQYRNKHEESELLSLSKNLDVVTSDLQTEVMNTRMQPIGSVLGKFQRMVRDVSRELGKKIDLTLEGSETELDKTLLEAIKDPITHLVRNSCDHGIEFPEERIRTGKPDNGHLLIRSFHEGGQVVIEISDDGRGLDSKKIIAKAIEKGILTAEQSQRMQEREIFNLIFMPGFTTANQVSSVSGRGVGMDVVKTNIAKVGGSVELSTITGKSTTIRLKIPLTLAIVPALMVKSGGEKFAIPQVKLVQLVRIEKNDTQNKIEFLQGSPMFRLRDVLLPLIDLRNVVHKNSTGIKQGDVTNIVILSVEKEYFGLIVDEILDTTDIVVKPLSSFLKHLIMFSGATILGDGTIALILDVIGIATTCKINTKKNLTDEQHLKAIEQRKLFTDTQEFLLFELDNGVIHSIPLCLINRLEEFSIKDIEQTGDQKVVRYRGTILPILSLNQILGYSKKSAISVAKEKLPVLVIQKSGKLYGVEVNEIQDIVTIDQQIDDSIRDRPGILGNLIHQQKVVAVVDALGLIEQVVTGKPLTRSTTIEEIRTMNREMKNKKLKILFADDVVFFRRHVSKVLTDAGYDITLAEDGKRALEIIDSSGSDHFNVIISDIEMPNMDGLSFARELRKRPKYKTTPLIALTTRFRDKDIEDGMKAGFDTYLEKLNPEKLLSAVSSMIGGNA